MANRRYGYRRIAAQLRREGFAANHKRVLRLMRRDNLLCSAQAPVRAGDDRLTARVAPGTEPGARLAVATGLDQLWVADITYVRLKEAFAYLAVRARRVQPTRRRLGVRATLQASLAMAAFAMALAARRPKPGSLIHHSDRGVQYACGEYAGLLLAHDIRRA